jgi:superfamily II DNA or RNA helicase
VHRTELLAQWKQRLTEFLELPDKSIGQIGGSKNRPSGVIDIATIQSMLERSKKEVGDTTPDHVKDIVAEYGQIIVDECHHLAATSFEKVLKQVKAKHVIGLTATPFRHDGHHPIIVMQCGPIRHKVLAKDHKSGIEKHVVIPRLTDNKPNALLEQLSPVELITSLADDEKRNEMIVEDILKAIAEKRSPLILTERTRHLDILAEKLQGKVKNVLVFKGGMGERQSAQLRKQLADVPADEERVVLATGKKIGEGFDDPRLDTLFLAMPFSWRGSLEQYAGRLHRSYEGKTLVQIYDYVDYQIPKFYRMFRKRQAGYKRLGYEMGELWLGEK